LRIRDHVPTFATAASRSALSDSETSITRSTPPGEGPNGICDIRLVQFDRVRHGVPVDPARIRPEADNADNGGTTPLSQLRPESSDPAERAMHQNGRPIERAVGEDRAVRRCPGDA
jgi:hypothetical protein